MGKAKIFDMSETKDCNLGSVSVSYTDGRDYKDLKPNISDKSKHGHDVTNCTFCGEKENVTILDDKDICHECGYVYE